MANYYGVKEGAVVGVYESWSECQEQIKGYPGAVYKKFKTRDEAYKFVYEGVKSYRIDEIDGDTELMRDVKKERALRKRIDELEKELGSLEARMEKLEGIFFETGLGQTAKTRVDGKEDGLEEDRPEEAASQLSMDIGQLEKGIGENEMIAYVDGSYRNDSEEYSYGMILFTSDGEKRYCEKYDDDLKTMRNVAGEIRGAEEAMKKALEEGKDRLYLHYDYLGIEKWAREEWKANKKGTQAYRDFYLSIKDRLQVDFIKVLAHSGDEYNDVADALAKEALGIS